MPSILLINENKIVSRLLQLSSQKNGYNFEEVASLDTSGDSYDVIFVDSDMYNEELMNNINSKLNFNQLGYIGTKQGDTPEGFDIVIEKPFLPTDFVNIIKEKVITASPKSEILEDELTDDLSQELLDEDDLELESADMNIDELLESDELDSDISLDELDTLDDTDLSLDSTAIMSTGIAASMATNENNNHTELADMVNEIEDMPELDEKIPQEQIESEKPVVSEEVLVEEDLLEELDEPIETSLDEEVKDDNLDKSIETSLEEEIVEEGELEVAPAIASVATGAALGAVATQVFDMDDEFDSLSENDIKDALSEKVEDTVGEEIISQEQTFDGEETVVESNDVEKWIKDAVANAITPQMIKEALDDMEINVTLNFKRKKEDSDS